MVDRRGLSEGVAVLASAVVGLAVATASVWFVSGYNVDFERLFRIQPTVGGGGVGTDFVQGNTDPAFGWLIGLIHVADVLLGLFILVMVFIHWASFRRLAARMKPPTRGNESNRVAADGGQRDSDENGGDSA